MLIKFLDSLEKQWLAIIVAALWLFTYTANQEKNNASLEKTELLESKIIKLEQKDIESAKIIDSLSEIDTVIVNRIKTIKQKEYVQVKVIDSLPISGLQSYFTERYPKR